MKSLLCNLFDIVVQVFSKFSFIGLNFLFNVTNFFIDDFVFFELNVPFALNNFFLFHKLKINLFQSLNLLIVLKNRGQILLTLRGMHIQS